MADQALVIIAGSNRSGTTWLQNMLGSQLDKRLIFEPLHPRISQRREWVRMLLEAQDEAPELRAYLDRVFAGKVKDRWMLQGGHASLAYAFRNRWWASTVVAKFVRANLMLPWLSRQYDAPIVYIVRHPCGVIASMRKMGWEHDLDWNFTTLAQDQRLLARLNPAQTKLLTMEAPSTVQRLALVWCVENVIPLELFPSQRWIGVVYETLVEDGEREGRRLYEALGWTVPRSGVPALRQEAHTASKETRDDGSTLNKWKRHLSDEEVEQVLAIVEGFGCKLYGADTRPRVSHLEALREGGE